MADQRPRFIDPREAAKKTQPGAFPGKRAQTKASRFDIPKQAAAKVEIRPPRVDDVGGLARVSIDSWRETYRGVLPDEKLDRLDYSERKRLWTGLIERPGSLFHFVAEDPKAGIVGFISTGTTRSHRLPYPWEIYSFYVLPGWLRRGIGRQLIVATFRDIVRRGDDGCCLWVLNDNLGARRFYKAMGGKVVAQGTGPLEGVMLSGEVFAWEELEAVCVAIGIDGANE